MNRGKIFALLGMAVLGLAIFVVVADYTPTKALVPDSSCRANRYADDGVNLTPYGPNACHKVKVFYAGGGHYETGNCGAGDWCSWLVHCPAGTTMQSHSSPHYSFSPNIDGLYDGPGHNFCVNSSGHETEPMLGRDDSEPYHSHSIQTTKVSLSKVMVVDTGAEYFWAYSPSVAGLSGNWVDCPAGARGPYSQVGSAMDSTTDFPNHFHCANSAYTLGSNLNPEILPVLESSPPSNSLVGQGFSTSSSAIATNQFVDKTAFFTVPIGSVMCVSTTSNKVYASTTGTCPAAAEFPVAPSYSTSFGAWLTSTSATNPQRLTAPNDTFRNAVTITNNGNVANTYTFSTMMSPATSLVCENIYYNANNQRAVGNSITLAAGESRMVGFECPLTNQTSNVEVTYNIIVNSQTQGGIEAGRASGFASITGATPVAGTCTALDLTVNGTSFTRGSSVNYTFTCASPSPTSTIALAIVQVVKPDGTATTYVTNSNNTLGTSSMGFETSNFTPGTYTLRVCMQESCAAATTVSRTFTVTEQAGTTCTAPQVWCPATSNAVGYCAMTCPVVPPPSGTTCGTGMIWCTDSTTAVGGYCAATCGGTVYTPPANTNPPNTSCPNGTTCPPGSQCQMGQKCTNLTTREVTCVAYNNTATGGSAPASMTPIQCPAGTTPCESGDGLCRSKSDGVFNYVSGVWCWSSMVYYSADGRQAACAYSSQDAPAGFSICPPNDSNCIPENSYGSSSKSCRGGMQCNEKVADDNPNDDVYCNAMNPPGTMAEPVCPAGYSFCSRTDTNCRQRGETWTAAEDPTNSIYCNMGQLCRNASGGGSCVGWNESCPTGTLYCRASEDSCVEPDSYKTIRSSGNGYVNHYWCGGGGGMTFYSSTQAYCPPKKAGGNAPISMMYTAEEIKAILARLGEGWGLCAPGERECGEPGETITGGWCAWWPPNYMGPGYTNPGSSRTCPPLDEAVAEVPPPPVDEPQICLQVMTGAYNSTTGECKIFSNSCIPEGWRRGPCEVKDESKPPVCGPNEIPGPLQKCRMPYYRLNIRNNVCTLEQCDINDPATSSYFEIKGKKEATRTRCETMVYGIEKEWREARCKARPPVEYGMNYWFEWDATAPMLKYSPLEDKLIACDARENVYATTAVMQFPCGPVPARDQEWYLKKMRADYQQDKLYREQYGTTDGTVQPVATPVISVPEVPEKECPAYLTGIQMGLMGDKEYWKNLKRQAAQVPEDYSDYDAINNTLTQAKDIIIAVERLLRKGNCSAASLSEIEIQLHQLRNKFFMQLSSFMPDVEDFVQYNYCVDALEARADALMKLFDSNVLARAERNYVEDWIDEIEDALDEFEEAREDGDFDIVYRCQNFGADIQKRTAPILRKYDVELNRIIDDVISDKLDPVLSALTEQLAKSQMVLDELLVQVAGLHQKVEQLSTELTEAANRFTERLTVSYSALSQIEEKFATEKLQIQAAKDRLTAVVEKAIEKMKEAACVSVPEEETLVNEFATVAAVNWIDDAKVGELERRINLFIASCTAKDVAREDISGFVQSVTEASNGNLALSYDRGLTAFADVPTHEWFYGAMNECHRRGCMTQGRPAESALRQDALLMLLRESGATDKDIVGRCAAPAGVYVSDYAACAINHAVERGLVLSGDMKVPAPRKEIASWIRTLQIVSDPVEPTAQTLEPYVDLGGLEQRDLDAIEFVVANGTMVGQVGPEQSTFQPYDPLTRAALSVVLEHVRE